jgi:hypothetical protein
MEKCTSLYLHNRVRDNGCSFGLLLSWLERVTASTSIEDKTNSSSSNDTWSPYCARSKKV